MASEIGFYEKNLLILGVVCFVTYFVDKRIGKGSKSKSDSPEERLENGAKAGNSAAAAALTRKYLLVYAIVMGECIIDTIHA